MASFTSRGYRYILNCVQIPKIITLNNTIVILLSSTISYFFSNLAITVKGVKMKSLLLFNLDENNHDYIRIASLFPWKVLGLNKEERYLQKEEINTGDEVFSETRYFNLEVPFLQQAITSQVI